MSTEQPPPPSMTPTDSELIQRSKQGDAVAFEQLVQRYDKRVLTIAASHASSSDDAKDIYQEVFIRVYKGLKKFEARSEFSTWLYRITTNVCLSHRSRSKRRMHTSLDEERGDEDGQPHALKDSIESEQRTDERAMSNEIAGRVAEAMSALSPKQKMVFQLRHYEGYKLREIAEMMEVGEGTVKKYLFEATARVRNELKEFY